MAAVGDNIIADISSVGLEHDFENVKLGGAVAPLFDKTPTECAMGNGVCIKSDAKAVKLVKEYVAQAEVPISSSKGDDRKSTGKNDTQQLINTLKTLLGVKTEAEIWKHPEFIEFVGPDQANHYLEHYYTPEGPSNSTSLVSSININALMSQWNRLSEKKFGRKFYGLPYQMADFAKKGTQLAKINIPELMKKHYDSFAVVMNTDDSTGNGEHWYCLYGDLKHKGTKEDPITVEYFNSSGNKLGAHGGSRKYERMGVWLEELKHRLLRDNNLHLNIHTSAPRQLQFSNTECGIWSLCYIHARLSGHPADYFDRKGISDGDMYEYRKHLFRPE